MLILGLGSNLGDSLHNLRSAVELLQQSRFFSQIKVSHVYHSSALLPAYARPDWNKPFLNAALACESKLSPVEVLDVIKWIEKQLGRQESQKWAPRIIDIDILAWGDRVIVEQPMMQIPHPELERRPFALWPLLDLLPDWRHPQLDVSDLLKQWGSRSSGHAPFSTKRLFHRLTGTRLVGILNLSPDSFSGDGHFPQVNKALAYAEKLVQSGAEVLDIGAESTRPDGAKPVSPDKEWQRLSPILTTLQDCVLRWPIRPKLSLDTRNVAVAEKAIDFGVDWINDVSGFVSDGMKELAAKHRVNCVVVHNLGVPACHEDKVLSTHSDIYKQILSWAKQRFQQLISAGVDPKRFIFDIGVGFGKTAQQSLFLIKNIKQFQSLACPLLVGHSRKSFLNLVTDKPYVDRDIETAVLSYQLALHGVDYVRVHNIEHNAQALRCAHAMELCTVQTVQKSKN